MLTSLRIQNFRSLRKLSVEGLTRVSLLVGANNTGKTSVLEAAELVLAGEGPAVLERSPRRRGEGTYDQERTALDLNDRVNFSHLFFGHDINQDTHFQIDAETPERRFFRSTATTPSAAEVLAASADVIRGQPTPLPNGPRSILVESDQFDPLQVYLTGYGVSRGSLRGKSVQGRKARPSTSRIYFMETTSPEISTLVSLWEKVVLTPEEDRVADVLRIIEPNLERIAILPGDSSFESARFFIKLKQSDQRIPIGSMGEGIKRLMSLSLNLVNAAGGYLLVDEIDTGLHHSVMLKMWRLVTEAAKRLNVQVIATTHSLDCVRALASLYEDHRELQDVISVHRLERGAEKNIIYSADELLAAAEHQMEIR